MTCNTEWKLLFRVSGLGILPLIMENQLLNFGLSVQGLGVLPPAVKNQMEKMQWNPWVPPRGFIRLYRDRKRCFGNSNTPKLRPCNSHMMVIGS